MSTSRQIVVVLAIAFALFVLSKGEYTTKLSQITDVNVAK